MLLVSDVAFGLVALLHGWFLVLEMFLWQRPIGLETFGQTPAQAATSAVLARNQGLYNGFLAAGLFWALLSGAELVPRATFFLLCVAAAGVFGAVSVRRTILYVQTVPAALALVALLLSR